MAYSSTNPPALIASGVGSQYPRLWSYTSTHAAATVCGSSFISNGAALGMHVGDTVLVLDSGSTLGTLAYVSNVTALAGATLLSSFITT